MTEKLAVIDYTIVVVYLAATLGLGLFIGRKIQSSRDYFLAGRRLPWWAIGMSLVATDIGGTDIIGVGGAAYQHGLAVGNFEWIGCVPAMIIGAFVFIPYFWRTGVYTIPEFMERRYNAAVRAALAICWLIFMACNLGIMLLASAKMMNVLFGWNQLAFIMVTAALVGVYTCAGGLAAVVYTDMIQCTVMIAGCLLVLLIGLWQVGGVEELNEKIREVETARRIGHTDAENRPMHREEIVEHTALILPVDTESPFPWTGIFFGLALILSPAYWIGNQAIVQRALGARSEFEAKASYVWGAVLKNLIPFIIAVPGLIAVVKFPELKDGDQAFPYLVIALLPVGLRGLFLAAFVAALMSSVDSYLNSASSILTNDLYQRFVRPQADERLLLWVGRAATAGLVAWATSFAILLIGQNEGIYTIFQTMMAFFQGPALAILLTGLLWRGATGVAAFVGFVSGVVVSIALFALSQKPVYSALGWEPLFQIADPFLYFSVWAFLVSLILVVIISFLTESESDEKVAHLIYHRRRMTES